MAKKDKSQNEERPSVRAQKDPVVHKRRAEKPQRGKAKPVSEAKPQPRPRKRSTSSPSADSGARDAQKTEALPELVDESTAGGSAPRRAASSQPDLGASASKQPASEKAGAEQSAAEKVSAEKASAEKVGAEKSATEQPASEKAGAEQSTAEEPMKKAAPKRRTDKIATKGAPKGKRSKSPDGEDSPEGAQGPEGDGSPEGEEKPEKPRKRRWGLWIGLGIAGLLIVALVVVAGMFSWNRWFRYDDAADMQGTWYAYGTKVPVTFADGSIVFDANTAYEFAIDPDAKTISYRIGDMEGRGRYWFSEDRTVLVITDGSNFTKWGTVCEDIGHWWHDLLNGESVPVTENSIAFSRQPMSEPIPAVKPPESSSSSASGSSASEQTQDAPSEGSSAASSGSAAGGDSQETGQQGSSESATGGKAALGDMEVSDIMMEGDA